MKPETGTTNDGIWRVFCAIEIPQEIREAVAEHISGLRRAAPEAQASWSRPENIHLTLKFLGEISQTRVEQLSQAASRAASNSIPFTIELKQTGCFPTRASPRVLWIGINDPESKLAELHAHLEEECAKEGFAKEARRYHPHLTVARLRKPQGARTLAAAHEELEFTPAQIVVQELHVIRSELGRGGSRYTVIARHPLTAEKEVNS
jgi:2'-5' RNA ligase